MTTRVYTFRKVRISPESAHECFAEIERGRQYYNAMIDELNRRVQEELEYIEEAAFGAYGDTEAAKSCQAKLIYRAIKRHARDVRAQMPASSTECYTGTYHAVQAAFDQATSSKRQGTWPGERFRRRYPGDGGEAVGVHIQGGKTTWRDLQQGSTSLMIARDVWVGHQGAWLKVSRNATIPVRVWWKSRGKNPRVIPDDAIVSHAMLCLESDYGTSPTCTELPDGWQPRGKWVLRITAKIPSIETVPKSGSVGVSIGWYRDDEGLLVAVTSDGKELRIPAYALRMADRNNELRSERDQLANAVKEYLPISNPNWMPKSAQAAASYIERHGLNVRADIDPVKRELFARFLEREANLRRTNDHVRRRFLNIRDEHYRKFVHSLQGKRVYVDKIEIKQLAESRHEKEDVGATSRFLAGAHSLVAMLKNAGAEQVPFCGDDRERLGDEREPTEANARNVLESGLNGNLHHATARKTVRKYRRSKKSTSATHDAPTMA